MQDRLCGLVVRVLGYRSRGPGFDSQHYQIFWQVVGLKQGLVSTIEKLSGRNSSGSGLEIENIAMGICCADHATPLTSSGHLVGIVRSRTKAMEFLSTLL
jgi:hypothetical protein